MGENITSTIKRHESTARFYKTKADREWAYAVNGKGGYHYHNARQAYAKADQFQQKADTLRTSMQTTPPTFINSSMPVTSQMSLRLASEVIDNTIVGDVAENVCDCIGDAVGNVVSDIKDGIEDFFDSLSFFW